MAKKLTPWFPPEVKPVRRGVYPTALVIFSGYTFWSGKHWGWQQTTPEGAAKAGAAGYQRSIQHKRWRGLAEPPKGAA